jgi:hypothetical protein
MDITQVVLSDGSVGIEIDDFSKPDGYVEEISNIYSPKDRIPQYLIDECERLYLTDGNHRFIFDRLTTNLINKKNKSVEESRDITIDSILNSDSDEYYISDYSEFDEMPSRFSFYDTETKMTCRWKRYNQVVNFFEKLQFQPGLSNLGPEFEQSYVLRIDEDGHYTYNCTLRLKPNLCMNLTISDYGKDMVYMQKGFFNKTRIVEFLNNNTPEVYKSILREIKLEDLLN